MGCQNILSECHRSEVRSKSAWVEVSSESESVCNFGGHERIHRTRERGTEGICVNWPPSLPYIEHPHHLGFPPKLLGSHQPDLAQKHPHFRNPRSQILQTIRSRDQVAHVM